LANALDALLAHIIDPELRSAIAHEVARLKDSKDFGLVFERHMPESVRLVDYPITRGSQVQERSKVSGPTWYVDKINEGVASLVDKETGERFELPVSDLVTLKGFNEVIYPGFKHVGQIRRHANKSSNAVINGENYYVLESLLYAFEEKVDAIYIDPPYNTGARDWKYNNDFVDADDAYRHSKWLAFMERRLKIAKRLLNPRDSVLMVTIDEKEYLRLGMLLEQIFPESSIEMVTSVISAKGVARVGQFSRVEEYIFFVKLGGQQVGLSETNMLDSNRSASDKIGKAVDWLGLRRREPSARRGARPKQFYPVFIDALHGHVESIGEPITDGIDRHSVVAPDQTIAIWPLLPNGTEGLWGITPETARVYLSEGFFRSRSYDSTKRSASIQYLPSGTVARIKSGEIEVEGHENDGSVIASYVTAKGVIPKRVWNLPSHNAETFGTNIVSNFLPQRRFPYPKSLYAVEDTLRFFVQDKPEAVILDFFAGSGTTGHAVMRLNKQDNGNRRFILVTNNEVSDEESKEMRKRGLSPGDKEWEARGIYEFVTKPRIEAAVSGLTPGGQPVSGDYKFVDEFPMSEGFEENVDFLELQYLDPNNVSRGKAFQAIAPLLWMKAGFGPEVLMDVRPDFALEDNCSYAILFDMEKWPDLIKAVRLHGGISHVFFITDSRAAYQQVLQELDADIGTTLLYEDYLRNFEISIGGRQ